MSIEDLTARWPAPEPAPVVRITEENVSFFLGMIGAELVAMAQREGQSSAYFRERLGWLDGANAIIAHLKASQTSPASDGEARTRDSEPATEPKGQNQ